MTVITDELPDDVAALKQLVADQQQIIDRIREEAARQLEAERERHEAELKAAIAALLRRYYGPRSERFDPRQLFLFGQHIDTAQLDQMWNYPHWWSVWNLYYSPLNPCPTHYPSKKRSTGKIVFLNVLINVKLPYVN